jgi:hypothetical protein
MPLFMLTRSAEESRSQEYLAPQIWEVRAVSLERGFLILARITGG